MSWFRDLFRGTKRRHARGNPSDDRTDSDGYTVVIPRGDQHRPAASEPVEWDAPSRSPFEAADVKGDAPTELAKRWPAPSPPKPVALPTPFTPQADDDRTVLGTAASVLRGRVVAVLLGVDGPLDGQVIRVFDGANLIGREGQPDPLPNTPETKTISRKHAMLTADGGYFAIEPVRPENATFVNEKAIAERELIQHGDRVRLGTAKPSTFVLLVVP